MGRHRLPDEREPDRRHLHPGRDGRDRPSLPAPGRAPGPRQVPRPRDDLPDRLPADPHLLQRLGRLLQLVDGSQPHEGGGDPDDPGDVARAASERGVLHDDARPRGRNAGAAARRPGEREDVRRHRGRARAAGAARRDGRERRDHGGAGVRRADGLRARRHRPGARLARGAGRR